MTSAGPHRVNIRPGVTILSVLQHLNYRPWYAMAEFVDNSLQSFLDCREALERVEGAGFKLQVRIEIEPTDGGRITIRDNAAGIHEKEYARAFRPAEVPLTRSGLAEFGMGMKSAACWFARDWAVRSSALGEPVERLVSFDIERIVRDSLEELTVTTTPAPAGRHFTEILLSNVNRLPQGRTVSKMKEHLASIYRVFLREGVLELFFDGEPLAYPEPAVLHASFYKSEGGALLWRKEIDFDFGLGLRTHGFAALRETASTTRAGFALFRRKRLIQGSADEGYRPELIFGRSNSYRYQRLFGELHLEGFQVSHTKDGFRWDENEEVFLQCLREELNRSPLPLLDQAEGHRVRRKPEEIQRAAEEAAEKTAEIIEREVPKVLEGQLTAVPSDAPPPEALPAAPALARRVIDVELLGQRWEIELELSSDPAVSDWVSLSDWKREPRDGKGPGVRRLAIRMALTHPFTERFGGSDGEQLEPLVRIAAAIMLAETAARESGVRQAGEVRRNINELLREALSKP